MAGPNPFENAWSTAKDVTQYAPSNNITTSTGNPFEGAWSQQLEKNRANIEGVLKKAQQVDPDDAAAKKKLALELGLPESMVGQTPDYVIQEMQKKAQRQRAAAEVDPITARQLQDPSFAELAQDDMVNMSTTAKFIEGMKNAPSDMAKGWSRGFMTNKMGVLGQRAQSGNALERDIIEYNRLKMAIGQQGKLGWLGEASTIVGQAADNAPDAIKFGLTTSLAAGTFTAVAGQMGPQVLVPEEIATVPIAMVGGFFAGYRAKSIQQAYIIEAGHSYMDMIEAGIDRSTAQYASASVGLVNAGLEAIGLKYVTGPIQELAKRQVVNLVSQKLAANLTKPTMATAWRNFGVAYGKAWAAETGTEEIQELVAVFGEDFARKFGEKELEMKMSTAQGREEIADRLIGTFESVGKGMAILSIIPGGARFIDVRSQAKTAEKNVQFITDLTTVAGQSKLKQRSPEQYQSFIAAQTQGTPVENIFIDAGQLNRVLNQAGVTLDQFAETTGLQAEMKEAFAGDGDVVIPTGVYAAKVAGTKVGEALQNHLRVNQDGMSVMEAIEFQKNQANMLKDAQQLMVELEQKDATINQKMSGIRKDVYNQIKATGAYSDPVSSQYADFVRDFVLTQSNRLKIDPETFYKQYGYKIVGQQQAGQMNTADTFTSGGDLNVDTPSFQTWSTGTKVADKDGAPIKVFRGEYGETQSGAIRSKLPSLTFTDSANVANTYAEQPNDNTDPGGSARVVPAYLSIKNPIINNLNDPFVDFSELIKKMGPLSAEKYARKFADYIENTGNWQENFADKYESVADLLDKNPDALSQLYMDAYVLLDDPDFVDSAKSYGYDGAIHMGNGVSAGNMEYRVFDESQVKYAIGTDVLNQRGKVQQPGRAVPDAIDAISNVASSFEFAGTQQFATNREFKLALQARVLAAAKAAKVDLSNFTVAVERYLVRTTLADAIEALKANENAVGWYNEKVTKALRVLSLVHPEIATDPMAKFAFTWALAATSNGLKVNANFQYAEGAYSYYKQNGVMPTNIQAGTAQIAINNAMQLFNDLVARDGIRAVEQFMTTMHTAKEVEAYTGFKVSGENAQTMVYGAAAIGPKIGNGFFANLYGHFEQLTMDRWLMRTWGRWTGTLVESNPAQVKAKRNQLKALIKLMSPEDKKAYEKILKVKLAVGKIDEVALAITKASMKPANRTLMNAIGVADVDGQAALIELLGEPKKGQVRIGFGDEMRKAGNALTKYLDGQKEAPSGPPERARIRGVFQQALTLLQQERKNLTMSDLQALLWYPEKRLYDAAKTQDEDADTGYEDEAAPDYANAAVALAKEKGIAQELITQTLKEVDNELTRSGPATGATTVSTAGSGSGDRGLLLQAGNRSGSYSGGSLAPLEGSPVVNNATGPDPRIVRVAEQYAAANGIDLRRQSEYARVDPAKAARIAQAYEEMQHDPLNPVVAEAYQNMMTQTMAQYQALVDAGYEFYFFDETNDPYAGNPWNAIRELRADQRMGVYATEAGFGSSAVASDNPLLADTGLVWMFNGQPKRVLANDLFRAVHDAFGHSLEGAGFRVDGEENAWQAHVRLYTGSAIAAITSETRGQNSWLHFGPFGEKNTLATVADTIFADQKTGLMPEFTWTDGRVGNQELSPELQTPDTLRQQSEQASMDAAQQRGSGMLNQPARGGFDPTRLMTILNKDADYSTFLHETGHFFLTVYADIASQPNAPKEIVDDVQALLEWFGVDSIETWNKMSLDEQRKYHEQFAYSFELYLYEGKAPNTKMQKLFNTFSRWLKDVYLNIRDQLNEAYRKENGKDLPILTDEIRSVMDRMVASEEQINQAEGIRNMVPMFQTQQESGMDDATWQAYQQMVDEAHNEAVIDLQKASIRQVKWLSNARSKALKAFQAQADEERKRTQAEVAEEVAGLPIYRAIQFLKTGKTTDEDGNEVQALQGNKLSIESVKALFPQSKAALNTVDIEKLGYGKYGMLAKEGLPAELVATMFGFDSAEKMVLALLDAKPMKEAIRARTDQRMMEENSDMVDATELQARVEEAVHNEARARFVAVELRFLAKATSPVRVMTAAARQIADQLLQDKQIGMIKPHEYAQAEARAAKLSNAASRKGDMPEAQRQKQAQLVQNQLAKSAMEARQEVSKGLEFFSKLFKAEKNIAKTRNMDLVNAAKSILAAYGMGQADVPPAQYIEKIRAYDPALYEELEPIIINASTGGKPFKQLTLNEFRSIRDMIDALWHQAKREKMLMIDGKAVELEEVVGELNTRLEVIGVPATLPGEREALSKTQRAARSFNTGKALLRRVEHWANATDGPEGPGAFTKYIWRPVRDAITAYRVERNRFVRQYADLISGLDLPVKKIVATEFGYTFGSANGGIGKAELLGALLHTGNESNYRKLLLGRGWGSIDEATGALDTSRWDAFVQRMVDEGNITKADMDFVQSVWDLTEEMKPLAQKAHKDIFGYYFNEVKYTGIQTVFGAYKGGYVPAKIDPMMSGDASRNAKMEDLEGDFRQSMPTTGMGFTKGRVEYNKPLDLDVRKMTTHIDSVLRFAYIQPVIKDVLKIVRNKSFQNNLDRIDPGAIEHMILPWLNRAARQQTSTEGMFKPVDKFWSGVRNRTGIAIMFANITNAMQQLTGWFPAMTQVKGTYLKSALWDYTKSPTRVAEEVAELSPFMADRMNNQTFDLQETMNELLLNPSKYDKIQSWAGKHGYFLQQAFQNMVDVTTWSATYNQTLANLGADVGDAAAQKEAIARSDAAVRLTQDSLAAEDIAAFQVGSPFYKTLIQFGGYFNMLANLNASEYTKIFRDLGWRGNKGKLFMTYLLGFGLPMLMADAIVRSLGGQWDDEDDDGYIDEFAEWFFMSQVRGATALIPFGTVAMVPFNALNDKPYDDRMSTSPSVSMLEGSTVGVVQAGINIVSPGKDVTGKNVRDILTLMSLSTGIPFMIIGKPVGYAVDVANDKTNPTSEFDYIRGLITGKASEESKKK